MKHRKLRVIVGVILAESRDAANKPLDILLRRFLTYHSMMKKLWEKLRIMADILFLRQHTFGINKNNEAD